MMRVSSMIVAATIGSAGLAFAADERAPPPGGDGRGPSGFREACGADIKTYCEAAKTPEERRACVDANKDKFSERCKSFMAAHPPPQGAPPPAGQ